jgi:hypothetical protein
VAGPLKGCIMFRRAGTNSDDKTDILPKITRAAGELRVLLTAEANGRPTDDAIRGVIIDGRTTRFDI